MKKVVFVLFIVVITMLAVSFPAQAQQYGRHHNHGYYGGYNGNHENYRHRGYYGNHGRYHPNWGAVAEAIVAGAVVEVLVETIAPPLYRYGHWEYRTIYTPYGPKRVRVFIDDPCY